MNRNQLTLANRLQVALMLQQQAAAAHEAVLYYETIKADFSLRLAIDFRTLVCCQARRAYDEYREAEAAWPFPVQHESGRNVLDGYNVEFQGARRPKAGEDY